MTATLTKPKSIGEAQEEVVEDFALFDDWKDRYQYIIELGRALPPMPDEFKTEANRVSGCQSKVWLHVQPQDDQIVFLADSDAAISKGLVSLLVRVYSGHTPQEIASASADFLEQIGLSSNLSSNRANGLASMLQRIKQTAREMA